MAQGVHVARLEGFELSKVSFMRIFPFCRVLVYQGFSTFRTSIYSNICLFVLSVVCQLVCQNERAAGR